MTEEAITSGGKKARRGRRQDDTLPPSRSRDVQRAFRARRAAHLTYIESTVDWLTAENKALRQRCGLPEDGEPLTGPAPEEEVIDGPMEPEPKAKKGAKGKGKAKKDEPVNSEGEMEDQSPRQGTDEARGAAEVLAGGSGSGAGTTNQPEHERRDSTTYPLPQPRYSPMMQANSRPSTSSTTATAPYGSPAQSYPLPSQQSSPRMQQNSGYPSQPHHNPQSVPYLVNHPHASVSYQQPPAPAYAPQYTPSYQNFLPNPSSYGSYYPPQYQQPHPQHNNAFAMTLPPPTSQPYPIHQQQNQRNSLSGPSQCTTPPSSHLRAPTAPTSAPSQLSPNPSLYPALIPPPSSIANLKTSSTPPSTNSTTSDFLLSNLSIFPTPSPEDEQFFLNTFCGLDPTGGGGGSISNGILTDHSYLMQSLQQYPDFNSLPSEAELKEVTDKLEAREREEKERELIRIKKTRMDGEYKEFCIGLMKGVRGIEGLIAKKRKRDQLEREEEEGGGGGKRKKVNSTASSAKKRKEEEDETVAFLAAAALANSVPSRKEQEEEEECCDGIIDCGRPQEEKEEKENEMDKECCEGIIDCGPPTTSSSTTTTTKSIKAVEECCSGLISCDSTTDDNSTSPNKPLTRSPLKPTQPLPSSTRTTIYLPRSTTATSTSSSSSCCGPNTSCSLPSPSPLSDAYILVTLAFSQLVPFMSNHNTTPLNPLLPVLTPTRIAEMLHNDTRSSERGGGKEKEKEKEKERETANLVIVPPGKEEEDKGKKGELYVRKDVVDGVRDWCLRATGQGTAR